MSTVVLVGRPGRHERVAFVTVDGADLDEIRVRFRSEYRTKAWRCEACGRSPIPACIHAHLMAEAMANEVHRNNDRRHRS